MQTKSVRTFDLARYGFLAFPLAFAGLPIYVHAPDLYASHLGVSLAAIGIGLLVLRIVDAVQDPIIGYLSDRYHQHRGAILGLGALALGAGFWMIFHPTESYRLWWFLGSVLICTTGFSVVSINLQTTGGLWVASHHDRTRITGVREALGLVGLLTASALPTVFQQSRGIAESFHLLSLVYIPLLACALFVFLSWLRKAELAEVRSEHNSGFTLFKLLGRSGWASSFFGLFILSSFASAIPAVLVLFFIRDRLGAEEYAGLFLVLYFLSGALGMPLWQFIAKRTSKIAAWMSSMLLASAAFVWAFLLGEGDAAAYGAVCVFSGLALGADLALPPSILADRIEEQGDENSASQYFSAMTFSTKAAFAAATGIVLPLLSFAGYQPNAANDAASLAYLSIAYALVPSILKTAAAILLARRFLGSRGLGRLRMNGVYLMVGFLSLGGCAGMTPQQYVDEKPQFSLREYFNGPVKAWGIIQDRSGNIVSRFDIDMVGEWDGDMGTLTEDFTFYDGSTQRRIWRIEQTGSNTFVGRADDIIDTAEGQLYGNAMRWNYVMDVPVGDSTYRIRFDDWMWLMKDGVLMNRSYMKKFGITVAEISIFMIKGERLRDS